MYRCHEVHTISHFWFFKASSSVPIAVAATPICSTVQLDISLWPQKVDKKP